MTSEAHLLGVEEVVRQTTFEDASNTFTSPSLIGPPTVEFAPYGRTPGGRRRTDARAGTIDQDPEFMAFLEGLANPTTFREASADSVIDGLTTKAEKVTTTPLVQFLKDKKASKNKESAAKAAKKQELQLAKGKSIKEAASSTSDSKKKGREVKPDRAVEKAAQEAVKILNREAAAKSGSTAASEVSASRKLDLSNVPAGRRSMVVAKHIKMLQRDLGLTHAQAHRQLGRDTADARKAEQAAAAAKLGAELKADSSDSVQTTVVPTAPKATATQANTRRARGKGPEIETNRLSSLAASSPSTASPRTPMVLLKKAETPQSTPTAPTPQPAKTLQTPQTPASRKPQSANAPSEGATQAFVKHANASQGVTEALLKEAMEKFGAVSMVEIDKRKGFAYVDFIESEGLKKAMAANPIPVAQGTVQVLQRKGLTVPPEKKPSYQTPHAPSANRGRGGRGGTVGRRGGRGARGGAASGGPTSVDSGKPSSSTPTGPAGK